MNKYNLEVVKEGDREPNGQHGSSDIEKTSEGRSITSKRVGSEETVKFDPSLLDMDKKESTSSSTITHVMLPAIKDETLLLFDCMPKGFESFLETGPSRRVVDYMDYEKLCAIQTKKIEYLKEQKVPQETRATDICEKGFELQDHFKEFDVFISEAQKKKDRAHGHYTACKNANRELNFELPRAKEKLQEAKVIRDALMAKVTKFEKVEQFIDGIFRLPDSQYLNFNAIMDRSSTLISTNKYLTKRFTERHVIESKLMEELQATNNIAKTHDIFIRREMNTLKKDLHLMTRENLDLEQKCNKWSAMTTDKIMLAFLLTTSIRNMANNIVQVRPYTIKKRENITHPCEMLDFIGLFISDYTDIVKGRVADNKVKLPTKNQSRRSRRYTVYSDDGK